MVRRRLPRSVPGASRAPPGDEQYGPSSRDTTRGRRAVTARCCRCAGLRIAADRYGALCTTHWGGLVPSLELWLGAVARAAGRASTSVRSPNRRVRWPARMPGGCPAPGRWRRGGRPAATPPSRGGTGVPGRRLADPPAAGHDRSVRAEVVTADAPLGEGPVWCRDGTLVISLISPGALARIDPASGRLERFVSLLGGANGAQIAADGGFVVANNGGIDFTVFADALRLDAEKIPYRPGPPGLQRVAPDGRVSVLAHEGLQAPNDLVVAADGTIYFTDPPPHGGMRSPRGE